MSQGVTFTVGSVKVFKPGYRLEASPIFAEGKEPCRSFVTSLACMAIALHYGESVLLAGPEGCGKSLLVETYAAISQGEDGKQLSNLTTVHFSPAQETTDLIGCPQPVSNEQM